MESKDREQVIIFKNDHNDGKRHFTWSDYCHFVYLFKYWILGITLIVAILGYLLVSLYWNPKKSVSTAYVTIKMPLEFLENDNGVTTGIKYLDGSTYTMDTIVSYDNIKSVIDNTKDADGNLVYSSLDADELAQDNAVSIALQTTTDSNGSLVNVDIGSLKYVLTAKPGEFDSESQMIAFFEDLIDNVMDLAKSKIPTAVLNSRLPGYADQMDTDSLAAAMSSQYEDIENLYLELLEQFQPSTKVVVTPYDGKESQTLSLYEVYQTQVVSHYFSTGIGGGTVFSEMANEINTYGYIRFDTNDIPSAIERCERTGLTLSQSLDELSSSLYILSNSIESLRPTIQAGNATAAIQDQYNSYTEQYTQQMVEQRSVVQHLRSLGFRVTDDVDRPFFYNVELYLPEDEGYDATLDNGTIQHLSGTSADDEAWRQECLSFVEKLDGYVDDLNSTLNQANQVYNYLYTNAESFISYSNSSKFVTTGSLSPFLGAAAGLILGYVLSSIALACYGYIKENRGEPILADASGTILPSSRKKESKEEKTDEKAPEEEKDTLQDSPKEEEQKLDEEEKNEEETSSLPTETEERNPVEEKMPIDESEKKNDNN